MPDDNENGTERRAQAPWIKSRRRSAAQHVHRNGSENSLATANSRGRREKGEEVRLEHLSICLSIITIDEWPGGEGIHNVHACAAVVWRSMRRTTERGMKEQTTPRPSSPLDPLLLVVERDEEETHDQNRTT